LIMKTKTRFVAVACFCSAALGLGYSQQAFGQSSASTPSRSLTANARIKAFESSLAIVTVDGQALRAAAIAGGTVVLEGLALESLGPVFLEVEPLRVIGPNTKIVKGRKGGVDEPIAFDFSSYLLFRGKVLSHAESDVVLFASPRGIRAHIDLGRTGNRYLLSSVGSDAQSAEPTIAELRPLRQSNVRLPDVPMCGRDAVSLPVEGGSVAGCCTEPDPAVIYHKRLAVAEIAIETDYELFANFNDLTLTTDYIIELIARTNAIFTRDVATRFEIVFIRLFDNPADEPPFMSNPDPFGGYANYWFENMGEIARDTATYLSGRRDLPYGGIAYIGAVCTEFAYCLNGYLNGFPDPTKPNSGDYDLGVVAHELGHNFNGCHTPDYCPQIDLCFPPPTTPQRGTMMSYCSQTVSGGNMVTELWYHTRLKRVMRDFVESSAFCLSYDCDQNGVDDAIDIGEAGADGNGNGVLDRCEDCNANSVLDPADIAGSTSLDLNENAIPDECEPDCNNNNVPDDRDILVGPSLDLWGNGVPDECDPDCDGDSVADYNEIQADLTLDVDRNVVLDSCQDCDGDGINDLVELMGARNAWVASDVLDYVGEYHAISGVRMKTSATGQITGAQDLIIAPGNKVLVSTASTHKVVAFNAITGASLGDFVSAGSGGLSYATGLTIGPNGNLFVSSRNTNNVLQYNGTTGAFIGAFVTGGSGGLSAPFGILFGPNGNLFVTSGGNQVLEYHGSSGAFIRVFVSSANNGGLAGARGMVFKPDGNLLVASFITDALLQYDAVTGAFLNKWNSGGTNAALYLDGPWGLRIGPNGNVFSSRDLPPANFGGEHDHDHDHDHDAGSTQFPAPLHVTAARIMEFDIANGQYLQSFIVGDDTLLRSTTGFDFMPGTADCDFNMLPDSCDLSSCSGDPGCSDCNSNGALDSCDIAGCAGSASCRDCNSNATPDGCDISAGTSLDVDPADGIPDECAGPGQ
jgi:outer membrane protein assembly factor BamB